ncbi:MAG: PEP-CTERM sorting domain-containing protein [Deltaproteobacteria bacterium]|nr:PEP-CTERM sorting domain-containing protein [Deltaproteobacteria bacterium]
MNIKAPNANLIVFVCVFLLAVSLAAPSADALVLGTDITTYDGSSSSITGWYGQQEDQEVEPGCAGNQEWDLEGFFLKGSELQAVGGFDFKNGVANYPTYTTGDIFIDTDGSTNSITQASNGQTYVDNNFGYEYVIDLSFDDYSYEVLKLNPDSTTVTVYYSQNQNTNPWKYSSGGTEITGGTFAYYASLNDADVDGLQGDLHYAITGFDLDFISGMAFTSHLTLGCGNDNLMGSGTAPVPEPATIILMSTGLLGIAGVGRKKLKKFHMANG